MFEFIRSNQKLMQFVLLMFIAPAFVLLGVSGYETGPGSEELAVVGDQTITQVEFDFAKRNLIERSRLQAESTNEPFDPSEFDAPQTNQALLDQLVNEALVDQAIQKDYLTASDEATREAIVSGPLFQVDGEFNGDKYRSVLASRGMSVEQHQMAVRLELARAQVLGPVFQSAFTAESISSLTDDAQLSGRKVRTTRFLIKDYREGLEVSPEDIQAYYADNQAEFMKPETVDVEYLVLDPEVLRAQIEVSDEAVAEYYEQNVDRFTTTEERQARHILFALTDEVDEGDLRAKAEKTLAELKENPALFAEKAKQLSDDPGSADKGGDLGFFARGFMVPEFEQAVFELEVDQISELVKTDFGFHIIQLTGVRGGEVQPLEEVAPQIKQEIVDQQFSGRIREAQATFSEKVFEGGQSFEEVEALLDLKALQKKGVQRTAEANSDYFANFELLDAVFSEDSLKNRNNTSAVSVDGKLVSARVLDYFPAEAESLENVQELISQRLLSERALAAAREDAQSLQAKLNDELTREAAISELSDERVMSLLTSLGMPRNVLDQVLDTPVASLPAAQILDMKNQGLMLAWITEVVPASEIKKEAGEQLAALFENISERTYGEALALAARDSLAHRIKVERKKSFLIDE